MTLSKQSKIMTAILTPQFYHGSPAHEFSEFDVLSVVPDPEKSLYSDDSLGFQEGHMMSNMDKSVSDGDKVFTILDRISDIPSKQSLPNIEAFLLHPRDTGVTSPPYVKSVSPMSCHAPYEYAKPVWEERHPRSWNNEEVMNFIYDVATMHEIDNEVKGEAFRSVTGKELYTKKEDDFRVLSEKHYPLFYKRLQQLIKRSQFMAPDDSTLRPNSPLLSQSSEFHMMQKDIESSSLGDQVPDLSNLTECNAETNIMSSVALIGRNAYDFNNCENFFDISHSESTNHSSQQFTPFYPPRPEAEIDDLGYISGGSDHSQGRLVPNLDSLRDSPTSQLQEVSMQIDDQEEEQQPPEKPKKVPGKRGRKLGQTTRGNHLWEFMRDLLNDRECNPSLVEWKDVNMGVFRVVQSGKVADLWGKKKKNSSMNYEKLSRAMRFCRDKGYFANLPKGGNYPKKLCFRFGERANGWQPTEAMATQLQR